MSVCLYVCMFVCLYVCMSVCLCIYVRVFLNVYVFVYLYVYIFICMYIACRVPVCLFVCLYVCLYIVCRVPVCLLVCLSVCLFACSFGWFVCLLISEAVTRVVKDPRASASWADSERRTYGAGGPKGDARASLPLRIRKTPVGCEALVKVLIYYYVSLCPRNFPVRYLESSRPLFGICSSAIWDLRVFFLGVARIFFLAGTYFGLHNYMLMSFL